MEVEQLKKSGVSNEMTKGIQLVKTYTDSIRHNVTIGYAYRCIYCGVIWTKLKDAKQHALTCKKETP